MIQACIFDLDGVICDTAKYHFIAWQTVAHNLGVEFTHAHNERLKGVSRVDSLKLILDLGGISLPPADFEATLQSKNTHYLELINKMGADEILPGVPEFLQQLKANKIKIGLGSASKNARFILDKLALTPYFDALVDGTQVVHGKPNPEVFLKGAQLLGVSPKNTVVFEDAQAGIDAALAGEFYAVSVGEPGSLKNSHYHISTFAHLAWTNVINQLSQ